jgi:hypothetical protein
VNKREAVQLDKQPQIIFRNKRKKINNENYGAIKFVPILEVSQIT